VRLLNGREVGRQSFKGLPLILLDNALVAENSPYVTFPEGCHDSRVGAIDIQIISSDHVPLVGPLCGILLNFRPANVHVPPKRQGVERGPAAPVFLFIR